MRRRVRIWFLLGLSRRGLRVSCRLLGAGFEGRRIISGRGCCLLWGRRSISFRLVSGESMLKGLRRSLVDELVSSLSFDERTWLLVMLWVHLSSSCIVRSQLLRAVCWSMLLILAPCTNLYWHETANPSSSSQPSNTPPRSTPPASAPPPPTAPNSPVQTPTAA